MSNALPGVKFQLGKDIIVFCENRDNLIVLYTLFCLIYKITRYIRLRVINDGHIIEIIFFYVAGHGANSCGCIAVNNSSLWDSKMNLCDNSWRLSERMGTSFLLKKPV